MESDPWQWDAGEVADFFRIKAADTLQESQRSRLPPSEDFFDALQSEGVNGECLLTAIDPVGLREEFEIKSPMTRAAVWRCICELRRRSIGYAAQHSFASLQAQTPQSLPAANLPETPIQPLTEPTANAADDPEHRPGEHTRSGEYQVQDPHGRKRRKLDLSKPGPKAGFVPSFELDRGYLPNTAISVEGMFYGTTSFGEEIGDLPADGTILVLDADHDGELDDNDFQFQRHNKTNGEVEFVHKRMQHFLNNAEIIDMTRQGRDALALLPYRQNDAGTRSATVIQFKLQDDAEPSAFKENSVYLNSTVPEKHVGGEWDFLMEKYGAEDGVVLPEYGESETALSESKSTSSKGGSSSMAEESVAADDLSNEQASEFIDRMLEKYVEDWQGRVASLERKKAYTVWKLMNRSRTTRQDLIETARAQIEHLKLRLQKTKSRLLESHWTSELSLEKMCGTLQVTAEDIEEQHWKISVWERRQEPPHAKHTKSKNARDEEHAPASTSGPTKRLTIPEHDRFSVSPPPVEPEDHEAEGIIDQPDTTYEADDEFHTPEASPTNPSRPSPDVLAGADDDEGLSPFVVGDDAEEGAEGTEEEESELPSPSNIWAGSQAVKREQPKSTPSKNRIMSIDLTGDSPSSETPTPTSKKPTNVSNSVSFMTNPDNANAKEVDEWQFLDLIKNADRRRILIKILRDAGPEKREILHECFMSLQKALFVKKLEATLGQLQVEGVDTFDEDHDDPLRLSAGIYLRWHSPDLLITPDYPKIPWDSARQKLQIEVFAAQLYKTLQQKNSAKFWSPKRSSTAPGSSSANPLALSSDNEKISSSPRTPSKTKKLKKKVERSQVGQDVRAKAAERARKLALAESQTGDSSQLAAMISDDRTISGITINPTRQDGEPPIYILDKIAEKIKPHQITGVRFLWLEVVTSDDDSGGRGCILAFTMGLGKTLTTIAFLAAVNEAAQSKERAVRRQLPKRLRPKGTRGVRSLRVLILCPPGLIPNWKREIGQWAGKRLGHVFCLDSSVKQQGRLLLINEWMRLGGLLIVGYEMFRMLLNPDSGKGKKKVVIADDEAAEFETSLLDGPEIVVADEAHNLKNQKAAVSVAAQRIKTEHKIALTGTPMSNDVQEVYSLVSWISPSYLGDPAEFRDYYAIPIKEGLYKDSERYVQRKGLMRLKSLHQEIKDKVNRANIEALRGSIPPKVEFVIFVDLQPMQLELYRRYVRASQAIIDGAKRENSERKNFQIVFLSMLAALTLLTNHPSCFKEKMLEPPKPKRPKAANEKQSESGDGDTTDTGSRTPGMTSGSATPTHPDITTTEQRLEKDAADMPDEHVSAMGFSNETIIQILGGDGSDIGIDPSLSSKLIVFMRLLKACLRANDKVIVFSQRLGMLDYLGELFKREKIAYGRIDGTNMSKRMQCLVEFENGDFDVMIVSTKAGGVGINMQCANRVFIFDSGFNPTYEEQAIGRAYRLGQKQHVYVYRFVASGTFETNIYNKQLLKTSLAQRVVDKKNPRRMAERNALDYMYEPKEVVQRDITEHIDKDPEVLGKLLRKHGTGQGRFDTMIRDVKTMETLTEEVLDEPLDAQEQQQMLLEAEARKQRTLGKRAGVMGPPPSTMPGRGYMPPPPPPPNMMPPPSTFAGPSNGGSFMPHPLGGLPSSRKM